MSSHQYSYPKVKATRTGPSAYERKTKVHEAVDRKSGEREAFPKHADRPRRSPDRARAERAG